MSCLEKYLCHWLGEKVQFMSLEGHINKSLLTLSKHGNKFLNHNVLLESHFKIIDCYFTWVIKHRSCFCGYCSIEIKIEKTEEEERSWLA